MTTLNQSDIHFIQSVLPLSELQRELFDKLESSKNKKLISDEISSMLSKLCEERLVIESIFSVAPLQFSSNKNYGPVVPN